MRYIKLLIVFLTLLSSSAFAKKEINIGWTAWSDAEIVTQLAKQILEQKMGYKVKLTMSDIGIQYEGISRGNLDVMLMAWLPTTHGDYYKKKSKEVVNLGPLYTRAKIGWVVPSYIPESEVASIEDLKKESVQKKLKGQIQGIDPGAGLMKASEKTIKEYDLKDYQLVSSSGAAMTAALARAYKRNKWIVVTGWSPHWKFARYKLRYLKDPKGTLGGMERVHALARKGFYQENPKAAEFFVRLFLDLKELETMMLEASEGSAEKAVAKYIKNNPQKVDYWVNGRLGS